MIKLSKQDIIYLIEYTLDEKLNKDDKFISYSFYELRVKYDLTEDETSVFLHLANNKLGYMGYKIYFTGEKYFLNNKIETVKDNELMIAVKA